MSDAGLQRVSDKEVALTGDLDFFSVPALWKQLMPILKKGQQLTLDLKPVGHINSAGLAMLIEAIDETRKAGGKLRILNPPAPLVDIAQMCNVVELVQEPAG